MKVNEPVFLHNEVEPFYKKDIKKYFSYRNSRNVIILAPYDKTVSNHSGTRKAPAEIIEASSQIEFYDEELRSETIFNCGGVYKMELSSDFSTKNPVKMISELYSATKKVLKSGKFPITIGGEHTVTYGAFKAVYKHYAKPITIIQLDAHTDLRNSYVGGKISHACVMRRCLELGPDIGLIQVGIRSTSVSELDYGKSKKVKTFFAHDIYNKPVQDWLDFKSIKDTDVYLTIDSDFFDWEVMRATGTPEPGGISWYAGLELIRRIFEETNVLGVDLVEVCPDSTGDKHSQQAAAKLIYKLVGYKNLLVNK